MWAAAPRLLFRPHPNPLPLATGGERLVARFDLSGVSSLREEGAGAGAVGATGRTLPSKTALSSAGLGDAMWAAAPRLLFRPHPNPLPLAGEGAGGERLVARFDLSGVSSLREDAGARARRHLQLVQAGILTINEVRAKEGLEPVPWGDGPNAAE